MTNKIIEAARQAEAYATSQTTDIVDWKAIAQERFYAIAYRAGLEDAAKVAFNADHMGSVNLKLMKNRIGNAIRKLKEQDAAIARATHKEQT